MVPTLMILSQLPTSRHSIASAAIVPCLTLSVYDCLLFNAPSLAFNHICNRLNKTALAIKGPNTLFTLVVKPMLSSECPVWYEGLKAPNAQDGRMSKRRSPRLASKTRASKSQKRFSESHLEHIFKGHCYFVHFPVSDFSLSQAICSYGYFLLPPNQWYPTADDDPDHGYLQRPLRYGSFGQDVIQVRIAQSSKSVVVGWERIALTAVERKQVEVQVRRMVRADMNLSSFHELHAEAKRRSFGRTYRSPTLFEDMIKTLTNCNITWKRTMQMNHLLCVHIGNGAFPTAEELSTVSPEHLKNTCKVGYRASWIIDLAQSVQSGALDLGWLEDKDRTHEEVYDRIVKLKGFAKFATFNVMQLLGYFDTFPFDTETVRLLKEHHRYVSTSKEAAFRKARQLYDPYKPFQFLAYWFDLWKNYEAKAGKTSPMWRHEDRSIF